MYGTVINVQCYNTKVNLICIVKKILSDDRILLICWCYELSTECLLDSPCFYGQSQLFRLLCAWKIWLDPQCDEMFGTEVHSIMEFYFISLIKQYILSVY